ncbi:J domain-containing protein [Aliarcobacter cryaerophilus]|uniref:J domain-containing protein n=1 Tax=Aliarcobacter cryaerophilus TaxID=28198 RepID=UPI00082B301C|nr:DnaJ domain-containing protein [Aliarcobacter cryaerophilus]
MNFLASFIRIAIFIGILYLIFTNFGLFLAIIGGIVLFFIIIIYFVKRALRKRAQQFQFEFNRFTREDYNNFDFKNFNNFNNQNFQGNFYNKGSKLQEAEEFFGFSATPSKDDIKKRFKELAKIYHPDLNGGDEEKMKKLNEYRDILMQAYGQ